VKRRTIIFVVASVVALGGCGGDEPKRSMAAATPSPAMGCASPAGNVPASDIDRQAIWPPLSQCTTDPRVLARSFATEYIGLDGEPELGPYREVQPDPPVIKIDILRSRGHSALTTLTLRVLDDAHFLYVTAAESPDIDVIAPTAQASISSPVTVKGRARGFEGNIVVEVRVAYATAALSDQALTAGSMDSREPFSTTLTFTPPAGGNAGAIVAKSGSGTAEASGFSAVAVRFSA